MTATEPEAGRSSRTEVSWQAVVWPVVASLGLLVFTQVLLPGVGRHAGRGAPTAILFSGLALGAVNALTAVGLVLVYRSTRIVNFAQTAIGAAGARLCFDFLRYTHVPFAAAFLIGLALAGAAGFIFELAVGRRFRDAPRLVPTVATIAAAGLLAGISAQVDRLPFFPRLAYQSPVDLAGASSLRHALPFAKSNFHVGHLPVAFGFAEVFALVATAAVLGGLAWFLRSTRSGVATRALAENRERAGQLGVSVTLLSAVVWMLAGVLSGAGLTLSGLISTPAATTGFAPGLLLTALAAGIFGRMRSLPITALAAIEITVATRAAGFAFPNDSGLIDLGLFCLIAAGLALQRRQGTRSETGGSETWQMTEEQRPVPEELTGVSEVVTARRVGIGIVLVAAVVLPLATSTRIVNLASVTALSTIVALSLVILTGWSGQVSLGQFGFAAIGAVLAGALTAHGGLTFWLAVPLATAATAGLALLVGIPALRIAGLFLAVVTFAFAFAVHSVLFEPRYFGWLLPKQLSRPTFLLLDFADERSMYFLCVGALVLTTVVVLQLRRSRFGRLLIAARENEANVASAGVSVTRLKLMAFAVSGGLAGFGGAIFAYQQRGLSAASFTADASLSIFIVTVLGGVSSVYGALLGSAYGNTVTFLLSSNPVFATLLSFGGPLLVLYALPGGLVSVLTRLRDGCLRILAQRRHLTVPSLFPGQDLAELEGRLVPMSPVLTNAGLAVLGRTSTYVMDSHVHGSFGSPPAVTLTATSRHEAMVLAAAAEGVGESPTDDALSVDALSDDARSDDARSGGGDTDRAPARDGQAEEAPA